MFLQMMRKKYMVAFLLLAACTNGNGFSLSSAKNDFAPAATETVVKVDVLWVVDSSGSMESSQENVAQNFQAFIDKFKSSKFDFQIAVISTDAWVDYQNPSDPVHDISRGLSRFADDIRNPDGKDIIGYTGVKIMNANTPDLDQVFFDNVQTGVIGNGDERGLQSIVGGMENAENIADGFPRKDALFAIIMLSDEDDFSHDGEQHVRNPSDPDDNPYIFPGLHPVSDYYDYLMTATESTEDNRKFIFNAITILDDTCKDQLNVDDFPRMIGQRYIDLADMTDGYKGSLCDDFSGVMSGITDRILEYTTRFALNREPLVESIKVYVDGIEVPQDVLNGWTYDAQTNSIVFHGDAIPQQGTKVSVTFDPAGIQN